jgi:dTDP-4-dehydrorhamnose reductase
VRILLFGKTGQIGSRLQQTLAPLGEVIAPGSAEADFLKAETLVEAVRQNRPELIVNAAAYTAVDNAETDELSGVINATAPAILAREAARVGAALVHYSTDYVFDGAKQDAYVETDATNPLNEYGRTKLLGEQAPAESGASYLIFRTSWIYAASGKNFLLTILKLAETQPELRIVADQVGCPTSADVVAKATAEAVAYMMKQSSGASVAEAIDRFAGVYHLVCEGSTSWHGFAESIVQRAGAMGLISRVPHVQAISTAEFPRSAKRPMKSVLSTGKFRSTFGLKLPRWEEALDEVLRELATGRPTLVRQKRANEGGAP